MADAVRLQILRAIVDRVTAIRVSDDDGSYATDAGERVYVNELPELGPDDPRAAIAVIIGPSDPNEVGGYVQEPLAIELQAHVRVSDGETTALPYLESEVVLADIKRAMEQPDRTLGGLVKGQMTVGPTQVVPREVGMSTVGVSVTYRMRYLRAWGTP